VGTVITLYETSTSLSQTSSFIF